MKEHFKGKFVKAWEFADSMVSRVSSGGGKVSEEIKDIRSLSCHGSEELNLPPCPDRMPSKKHQGSFFCGACNCGDFAHTQLTNLDENHYSKLDYPRVRCPRHMPGFNDYIPMTMSVNDSRKGLIEETFGVDYLSRLNEEKKQ